VNSPRISAIVTTYNEGPELGRTLQSLIANTRCLAEVIVVDDGSTDGSCDRLDRDGVRVMRHAQRVGVARSRDEGSRAATGDVLCYLDAHQRLGRGCLDRCAERAIEQGAVVCPDVRDYGWWGWRLHGAEFQLCPQRGYFSARWRQRPMRRRATRVTALRAPPYALPRRLYPLVGWSRALEGWGASEASLSLKAFFSGIAIWHLAGPLARHRFQRRFTYPTTWEGVWQNQAIIARVCFDDSTWFGHWLPRVFGPHLTPQAHSIVESPAVQGEHADFLSRKVKSDRQFWRELLQRDPPPVVRDAAPTVGAIG
jgi:glycosyltransferase involved in cell wall biosynthesis